MIGAICDPPKEGEPSYPTFIAEKTAVLQDLQTKATLATTTLNSLEGVSCNALQGTMYAFPQLRLPEKAIAAAKVCLLRGLLLLC